MINVISSRITKFEGIEFEKILDILINSELKNLKNFN